MTAPVVALGADALDPAGDGGGPLARELEPLPPGTTLRPVPLTGPLPDGLDDVDVVVAAFELRDRVPALLGLPRLRLVQVLNVGVETILPLVPDGVTLCNASGAHDGPVAEWVVAVVLAMRRRIVELAALQRTGTWDASAMLAGPGDVPHVGEIADLDGATVLVVGHGSIGRALEARLVPFGARVRGVARTARPGVGTLADLPALLPEADVVVLLAPHTPETDGLVDAAFLARMRAGALLVNAARGPLVDTGALVAAVGAGRVRAALDVTDPEPLPPGHPLWTLPGVLVTPHVGGSVRGWQRRAWRFAGQQLRRYAAGEPLANVRTRY